VAYSRKGDCEHSGPMTMQCTYCVTLWRVRVTIIVMGTQKCLLCVLLRYTSPLSVFGCCKTVFVTNVT
jgi:hypothetical protein